MVKLSEEEREGAVYVLPAGYQEGDYEMSEEEQAFNQFKDEARDNENYSKIVVSRVPMNKHSQRGGQKLIFLFECGVDEYTYSQLLSHIRDEYGSGFYKVQARNELGQLKLNKTVVVEAPRADTAHASANTGSGNILANFSAALREHSERTENMFREFMPQGQANSLDQFTQIMGAMGAMFKAIGFNPQGQTPEKPKTLMEQLTEFKMVKELFEKDGSGGDSEDNLYTVLGKTLDAFGGPIAAALAAGSQSGQLDNNGVVRKALPNPKESASMLSDPKYDALRKNVGILLKNAQMKIPPTAFAQVLVANTPPEQEDALWEFISNENCVDEIVRLEPKAEVHRAWLEALREAVLDLMTEPDDDDEDDDKQPGAPESVETETGQDLTIVEKGGRVSPSAAVAGEDENGHDDGPASESDSDTSADS